jgi:regulator of RNase E activity RraA
MLEALRTRLYTAVVGDVLDKMGCRRHFLPPEIRPLSPEMVIAGRAMPVIVRDDESGGEVPFGKLLEALDALREDEVYITDGGRTPFSLWGELMSTRALHLKAAGAVMNGYCRDTAEILKLNFPTFSRGSYALDICFRGKVEDYRAPAVIGGVPVKPGDIVFGDRDGVMVIPAGIAEEAVSRALEKVESENQVREGFRTGMSAVEAFRRYKAL